jgi:hypothetical protein
MHLGSFRRNATIAGAVACLAIGAAKSLAVIIPLGTNSGWQAVIADAQAPFVDVVTDGQTTDTLFIEKAAEFFGPAQNGVLPPVDIVFQQVAPSTITHIVIDNEIITNSTGSNWLDFHFEIIGSGAAFNPAATLVSGGPPPIGFTIAPFTTAAFGPGNLSLDIGGGVVPNGSQWFPGDAPGGDGSLVIDVVSSPAPPFTSWTLRERPTIPEPSVLGGASVAALALAARKRR